MDTATTPLETMQTVARKLLEPPPSTGWVALTPMTMATPTPTSRGRQNKALMHSWPTQPSGLTKTRISLATTLQGTEQTTVQPFVEPRSLTALVVKTATATGFLTPPPNGHRNKALMHARLRTATQALTASAAWTPTETTTPIQHLNGEQLRVLTHTLKTQHDGSSNLKATEPSSHPPMRSSVVASGSWSFSHLLVFS